LLSDVLTVHRPKLLEVIQPKDVPRASAKYRPLRPQALQPASHRGKDLVDLPNLCLGEGWIDDFLLYLCRKVTFWFN
jgi:hypothetical protein